MKCHSVFFSLELEDTDSDKTHVWAYYEKMCEHTVKKSYTILVI